MAIRFRITDTARGHVESMRNIMRRRAAWLMSGIVTGFMLLLWALKVFIAPPPEPEFVIYSPPQEESSEDTQDFKDISGGAPDIAPPVPSVIVSLTDVSTSTTFTMDVDISDMPITDSALGSSGMGGDGLGDGVGSGSKKGGMGGKAGGFAGVFYDLKKKNDGKDSPLKSPIGNTEVLNLESRFYNTRWELSVFSPYYRSKQLLYTSCFYMPNCLDEEASHAYDPNGKLGLKPSRWVAVYRAKVKAPMSGTFRFVGVADSVMGVRFDGKNVLACGLHNLNKAVWGEWTLPPDASMADCSKAAAERGFISYKNCDFWNKQTGGFAPGEPFTVKAGQWYEMQVMVSEIGGGAFGFCLLIDDVENKDKKRTREGQPLFQLFRTDFSAPTAKDAYENIMYPVPGDSDGEMKTDPPYDPDSLIWEAKPVPPDVKMK